MTKDEEIVLRIFDAITDTGDVETGKSRTMGRFISAPLKGRYTLTVHTLLTGISRIRISDDHLMNTHLTWSNGEFFHNNFPLDGHLAKKLAIVLEVLDLCGRGFLSFDLSAHEIATAFSGGSE